MTVSIIIPCFNAGKPLSVLIESILQQQTEVDYEVIIQDGLSTDHTTTQLLSLYEKHPHVQVFREKDTGIYDAMNRGISHANGDWLYFIGADDKLYSPFVLEKIFGKQQTIANGTSVVIGRAMFGERLQSYRLNNRIYLENCVLHQAAFYHKSVFETFRYDALFSVSSDYDLNFFCYRQQLACHYVQTIICQFSVDGISCEVHWKSYQEELAVRKKHIHSTLIRILLLPYTVGRYGLRKLLSLWK